MTNKLSFTLDDISEALLSGKKRKSQQRQEQGVISNGFSFKVRINTRRTLVRKSGEGLKSPSCPRAGSHFFLLALSAALVVFPETSLGVVDLMTPTATVCLMSLTANLPRGGNSAKGSTHMGLLGINLTMAASPDLMNLGASSVDLPVRRSTFSRISANLQAMWAVWQSSTGE